VIGPDEAGVPVMMSVLLLVLGKEKLLGKPVTVHVYPGEPPVTLIGPE
jgi:hypothetical protein